jgi:hypothetical protein
VGRYEEIQKPGNYPEESIQQIFKSLFRIRHMLCVAYTPQCFLASFAPDKEKSVEFMPNYRHASM